MRLFPATATSVLLGALLFLAQAGGQVTSKEPGYGKAVRSGSVSKSAEVTGTHKAANVLPPASSSKSLQQQLTKMERQSAAHTPRTPAQTKAAPPVANAAKPEGSDNKNVAMNFKYQPRQAGMKANGPPNSSASPKLTTRPSGH
jgi:hypothetical protein